MNFIYYNVSGVVMEILQFLLSFFASEYGNGVLAPVLELLKQNSFDISKTLKNLKPEVFAPIAKEFFSSMNKKSPTEYNGRANGLSPVKNIADKEIIFALNRHLGD